MSRKPENKFMGAVHKQLPDDAIYKMKITPAFTSGEFDVLYEGYEYDLFVEYKFLELPKRRDTMIHPHNMLSEKQIKWGNRRVARTARSNRPLPYMAIGTKVDGNYYGLLLEYHPTMTPFTSETFRACMKPAKDIANRILSLVS